MRMAFLCPAAVGMRFVPCTAQSFARKQAFASASHAQFYHISCSVSESESAMESMPLAWRVNAPIMFFVSCTPTAKPRYAYETAC